MKIELDQQQQAKMAKHEELKKEDQVYFSAQQEHLKLLDQKERDKLEAKQIKIMNEKHSRDEQIKKTEHKRRKEARESRANDIATIQRYQDEMEKERLVLMEKKRQEKAYFLKMIDENKRNQDMAKKVKEKERLEDIRAQDAYAKMLD